MNFKNFVWFSILTLSCEKKIHNDVENSIKKSFQFTEIGKREISEIIFPDHWNIEVYSDSEAPPMTKEALYFEKKLNDLDYFTSTKGRLVKTKFYDDLIGKNNQKIGSVFILDSISNKNMSFVYIKSVKTENDNFEYRPTLNDIDLLIFSNSEFIKKLNIYSYRDYPYSVGIRLGYLNAKGDLYIKDFEVDEEKTALVKEEHLKISDNGNIKIISDDKKSKI